jgi:hypothetical protein
VASKGLERERRRRAAEKYRPTNVKLLLITEAPPKDPSRYFYYEEVFAHDSLFREVVRAVLAVEPTRADKPRLLELLNVISHEHDPPGTAFLSRA